MKWTEEDIAQVFAMVGAGTSMAVIAKHFGCTRCAVIGLYRRERLKRGTLPPVTPRKRVLKALENAAPVGILPEERTPPAPHRDTVEKDGGGRCTPLPTLPAADVGMILPAIAVDVLKGPAIGILDVTGCRWPVGADEAIIGRHTFCNADCQEGQSYCPEHRRENKAAYSRTLINETIRSAMKTLARRRAA